MLHSARALQNVHMCHVIICQRMHTEKKTNIKKYQSDQKHIRLIKDDTYKFVPGFLTYTMFFPSRVASCFQFFNCHSFSSLYILVSRNVSELL